MKQMIETWEDIVRNTLSPFRQAHTQGVVEVAMKMASAFGQDGQSVHLAALVHDAMREKDPDVLLLMAEEYGLMIGSLEKKYPILLHGPLAAAKLRREYGVTDESVLQAISAHTTGEKDMGVLAKIIYIADMIEKNRDYPGVERLRKLSYNNIELAFGACLKHNVHHLIERERKLHRDTVECWNQFAD